MKFDLLTQSIELNAGEVPSLYNALNMIRSLFQDVEAAADAPLSQCPIGNEKLPLEMIWLSKELLEIYESKDDSLRRNRARLDAVMTKLRDTKAELETLTAAAAQLPAKEAEYEKLTGQLADAKRTKAAYDNIVSKTAAAQQELAELQKFDAAQAQTELTNLTNQISTLTVTKETLESQLKTRRQEKSTLDSAIDALKREDEQDLQPKISQLTKEKEGLEQNIRSTNDTIRDLETSKETLTNQLSALTASLPGKQQARDSAQKRVDDYQRDILDPVEETLQQLLAKEQELQTQKDNAEHQISDQKALHNSLILEIGKKKGQYDTARSAYLKAQEREKALQRDLDDAVRNLELQQKAVEKLEKEDLPTANQLLKTETERAGNLQKQIDAANSECEDKTHKIQQMERDQPGLDQKVRDLRKTYSALTATYNASNSQIEELDHKIEELIEKNDEERLTQYRTQRETDLQKLHDLEKLCNDLEGEIKNLTDEITKKTFTHQGLLKARRQQQEGLAGITRLLKELEPCTRPEYLLEVEKTKEQYAMLSGIRTKLVSSINDVRQYVLRSGPICNEDMQMLEELKSYLDQASIYSGNLYQELIEAASKLAQHITVQNTKEE